MTPMEQKAQTLGKNGFLLSLQCFLLIVVSLGLLAWFVLGHRPIQESMVPLDCLNCFVFKLDTLCSNSVFLLLLCNAIIGTLMALNKNEAPDLYTVYFNERDVKRIAEAYSKGKNCAHSDGEIAEKFEIEGGDCCSEEKSKWASNLAVVPYEGDISNEELDKKFDQFITQFRRQMSLER